MPRPLVTFVHISDLHIGEIDSRTGDAIMSQVAITALNQLPFAEGLLGHSGSALEAFTDFLDELVEADREDRIVVLVTGDSTRYGANAELSLMQRFLTSGIQLRSSSPRLVGLFSGLAAHIIPGNHDHWAGQPFPIGVRSTNYYAQFTHPLPRSDTLMLGRTGKKIRLIQIDSDADVAPQSTNRLFARGNFISQLQTLDTDLPSKADDELRVLLVHHSRAWDGFLLGMTDQTKREFDHFLLRHEIAIILCGHTHIAGERLHQIGSRVIPELGAGSTSQVYKQQYKHQQIDLSAFHVRPNSLMLHRVGIEGADMIWDTSIYFRSALGFTRPYSLSRHKIR